MEITWIIEDSNRTKPTVIKLAIAVGLGLVMMSAVLTLVAAQTIVPGYIPHDDDLAGARYKSFANTNDQEIYLGIPDLGVGSNRAGWNFTWRETNTVTFRLDRTGDRLKTTVSNLSGAVTLEYPDLANQLAARDKQCTLDDLNVLQVTVAERDAGATVNLNDVSLDGLPLGDFDGVGWTDWMITDYDFSQGFALTGTLVLMGPFGSSSERSKVELKVGCLRGSIEVTKIIDPPEELSQPGPTFQSCLTGPSYPTGREAEACRSTDHTGGTLAWRVKPGVYTLTEQVSEDGWTTVISPAASITVQGNLTSRVTVTNTYGPPPIGPFPAIFLPIISKNWQ